MSTGQKRAILVHIGNRNTLKFQESSDGLYFYDTAAGNNNTNNITVIKHST